MSFRNRLTIFFIVLVILPMLVVATVGFILAAASERGKTDARLNSAQHTGAELVRGPARHRLRGGQPLLADVVQRDVRSCELREREQVTE